MRRQFPARAALVLLISSIALPTFATDVDGPDDCQRGIADRGDAPEGFNAYPAVPGHFPTCTAAAPAGTQEIQCTPISTTPGPTGFVLHTNTVPPNYWLGCVAGGPPMGIDSETDGKASPGGAPMSACADLAVDCVETTPAGDFGQDECFGGNDAGLTVMPAFAPCSSGRITFRTYNCGATREVYLNVLIDMNRDGDWNDNFECPTGCAYEWAVKNVLIVLPAGCSIHDSPVFLVGPNATYGWMRISISDNVAPNDFPWRGSAGLAGSTMTRGETEDYLVTIGNPDPCDLGYKDYGDAPEGIVAYTTGIIGRFPTCSLASAAGNQQVDPACTALSTPPGPTGYVEHVKLAADPNGFWIGCNAASHGFVDSETDGKINVTPPAGTPSACNAAVTTDCVESPVAGLDFGQDECFLDGVDAGLAVDPVFFRCDRSVLRFHFYNCSGATIQAYVNILVDWNQDGDWNDVDYCPQRTVCAPEWAVMNVPIQLPPGCSLISTPLIQAGSKEGLAWMRVTLTDMAVPLDFPWNGSISAPNGFFRNGETEDYVARIDPSPVGVNEGRHDSGLSLSATPNPSATSTSVRFAITREAAVRLAVYDVAGHKVRTLLDEMRSVGAHSVSWDFRNDGGEAVAPGMYLVRLEAEDRVLTQRITRIR
jgi:hypothetical protein